MKQLQKDTEDKLRRNSESAKTVSLNGLVLVFHSRFAAHYLLRDEDSGFCKDQLTDLLSEVRLKVDPITGGGTEENYSS